ncbi:hypothetical protein [Methanolapillus ohkumae]|uniref:Uncharacterized protein n=1 Tax=Methanolapillus ohkumae TaxID=3028298 RepID=A0AA96ZY53_9EURY|nr:hypothetical protein MsAm2_16000 [Methanosarcinaceae archaeon Am2]
MSRQKVNIRDTDGQDADGQDADGQDADGQDADGQDADSQDADGQDTNGQDTDVQSLESSDSGSDGYYFSEDSDLDFSRHLDEEVVEISNQAFLSIGRSFSWILSQINGKDGKPHFDFSVKELSNLILCSLYWSKTPVFLPATLTLLQKQNQNGSFGDIKDTARAVSCLSVVQKYLSRAGSSSDSSGSDIYFDAAAQKNLQTSLQKATDELITQKKNWAAGTDDIYDLVYALAATADAGIFEPDVCLDVCRRDLLEWKFPGTTALILTALQKQRELRLFSGAEDLEVSEFISRKSNWLILERRNGFWNSTATSCLVLLALSRVDNPACVASLPKLFSIQEKNGSFENDFNKTCLAVLAQSHMSKFLY